MVNDEMLKKLKSQYIGVEVPDDEKMKLNEVLEYAKIDKKRKRKKVIIARWMISVAALLLVVIIPNTNETLASSLKNIPLVGNIFTVITVRKYDKDKNIKVNMAKVDSNGDIKNKKTVEKLNNDIKKYTNKIVNQYKADLGSSGFSDLYMDYKIVVNNDKWFTIAFTINETGASGYEFHRYYNIDKSSGKIVSLKDMFKKRTLSPQEIKQAERVRKAKDTLLEFQAPEGLFQKCNCCGKPVYNEDLIENDYVCPVCGNYFRIRPKTRIAMVLDKDTFEEWDAKMDTSDPLNFPGYKNKLERQRSVTNLDEAVITGKGKILGKDVVIAVMGADFMMGSMGEVVGEKITRAVERATQMRLPIIIFTCSGGARMQEGIVSLMQMAKTSAALKRHDEAGLLYITVLTDPTTGGVTASFAMLGDVILAEPGALIGFAGPRVIEQTIGQKLPEGFQRAEFLLEHGFVDKIVERKKLRKVLVTIIRSCEYEQ